MAAELITKVREELKEETFTRSTVGNYTQERLNELYSYVKQAEDEKCIDELLAECDDHLATSKESIIAMYISAMLTVIKGDIDNSALVNLVDTFEKNHKELFIADTCTKVLEKDASNKFALRTLAAYYKAENNPEMWKLYTTLIRIDFEECELVKALADHYEAEGDVDTAIDYYKKALLRYVNAKNQTAIKEIWTKLVNYIPQEIDFFQLVRRKIAKTMGAEKTIIYMQELYGWYKNNKKWDIAITILKQNLEVDPQDGWARKEITDCYREKYADHSNLEDYIRTSNLGQSYRNVFEAINNFEKHIAFDKGNFVFHRNWGVGLIHDVKNDMVRINFGKLGGKHEISLKMAVTALTPLSKDHIWVQKATKSQAELKELVKKDEVWTLKTIISSFGNSCSYKKIKEELVPAVLTPSEWTSFNTKAKKALETNACFGVNPNDINEYIVRDNNITPEEKYANEFKAQKDFFKRVDIFMKYFKTQEINAEADDTSSENFAEMYSYFTGSLKNIQKVTEQVMASYLVVTTVSALDRKFAFPMKETFKDLYDRIEDPRVMYNALKDTKNTSLKDDFVRSIRMLPEYNKEYLKLFPCVLKKEMLSQLVSDGYSSELQAFAKEAFDRYRDYRETILFLFENCQDDEWFKAAEISFEKQLIALINIIELTFREINNHVNSTENKKINKNATDLLFKNDCIFKFMFEGGEATVRKMYTLINDIPDFDISAKQTMRSKILEKFPDYKFPVSEEKTSQPKGIYVTVKKLEEKKAQIEDIQNVQLPNNAKDIADAREKGDLKENAEYHAARDRQKLLGNTLATLQNEVNRAVIFDPTTLTTSVVSFGTIVTLKNEDTGKDEEYTILGPWESDPDKNVISYMSPFGNAILDKKVGEKASFVINEHGYNFTVKAIKAYKF